jgi:anti-sigma factor RsiW
MNLPRHPITDLDSLLGPSGFEVTCEQCFELLDRYVDLELDGIDADAQLPGLRAHLSGCPACAEDYESLRAFVVAAGTDS